MAHAPKTSGHFITRFAPSPTGYLHKGHAYAALTAYRRACNEGGMFILRIEDIDQTRCRPAFTQAIYEDLDWLGIKWPEPVRIQSQHFDTYRNALEKLKQLGLVYPCFCTRKDIIREIDNAPSAPHGPDGPCYPGTCRKLSNAEIDEKITSGKPHALRLNLRAALSIIYKPLGWHDEVHGFTKATPEILGDIVLARKDTPTSYHLSVVVDDALQNITHVIRGEDLLHATHIHVVLQTLLGFPVPIYHHHPLLTDNEGRRLAKRSGAISIRDTRMSRVNAQNYLSQLNSGEILTPKAPDA